MTRPPTRFAPEHWPVTPGARLEPGDVVAVYVTWDGAMYPGWTVVRVNAKRDSVVTVDDEGNERTWKFIDCVFFVQLRPRKLPEKYLAIVKVPGNRGHYVLDGIKSDGSGYYWNYIDKSIKGAVHNLDSLDWELVFEGIDHD